MPRLKGIYRQFKTAPVRKNRIGALILFRLKYIVHKTAAQEFVRHFCELL